MNKEKKLRNPFVYEGYESPDYFCDRHDEMEKVISNLENGRNITLISPRKIGKTGLIQHTFHEIKERNKDAICIYIDIFHTQNQYDLAQSMGSAIVSERLLSNKSAATKILKFFSSWRPAISFDPLTGVPAISISTERTQSEYTIKGIFDYLKNCGKEIYFAIDEFQAINDYPEKGTEALLRSHIQFIHNVHFIFSGSKQHLMFDMFGSPKRPFYQSTVFINLEQIREDVYYEFAAQFFRARNGALSREVFHEMYQQFDGYTWYIQSTLNHLYERGKNITDYRQVQQALLEILTDRGSQYESLLMFMTNNQINLLKAIAREEPVAQLQSNDFIQRNNLPSSSSVKKAIDSLSDKDLVYRTSAGYIVYDRFFGLWLRRL